MSDADLKDSPYPVRLGTLKAPLQRDAAARGHSLHAEILDTLYRGRMGEDHAIDRIFDALDLTAEAHRMRTTSTTADLDRLLLLLRIWRPDRLILGRRPSRNNGFELTAVIAGAYGVAVMDGTYLNMARQPREYEIQALFRDLDRREQMPIVEYCIEPLPETRELPPAAALAAILDVGKPNKRLALKTWLKAFAGHEYFDIADFQAPRTNAS